MNVQEIIDTVQSGLMWVGLRALAAIAAACVGVWLFRSACGVAARMRRLRSWIDSLACAFLFAACVLIAGTKTNSPPAGIMMPLLPPLPQSVGQTITEDEIAQGWRLYSVTTNDAVSYAMPTNGVAYAPWTLRGGRETRFALDLGDFAFPFGTGVVRRLDVLSGGTVESLPRQRAGSPLSQYSSMMLICAAREWASIVPGTGRFWWADAEGTAGLEAPPYQAKLLTWENVYAGRDCTGQYNAQIELRDDGNFTTRSNNVESAYRRVLPCDLDYDGLPDAIDPDPETPLVPPAWNQAEAWAAAAFPSNVADIAAAGGYAAWADARGADPDRRLVSLGVAFDDGSAWPALLGFGGVPAMADGREELAFAIDCGAKTPFSLSAGRLASVEVTATQPPMRSGDGGTTMSRSEFPWPFPYDYPFERYVGDVRLHLDGPRSGWLLRVAEVSVDPSFLPHLFPGDSAELTATVSGCHPDAYLGCTWHGGEGIAFSHEHSLSTVVTYDPDDPDVWATNGIDLVTRFVGYSLTNHMHFTVGITNEPPLRFSIGCQEVFFLNDADFLAGDCPSNRPERIRFASLHLSGPVGTNGIARLAVQGSAEPVVFHVVNGATNLVTASTEIPLAVTDELSCTGDHAIYVSCPKLGTGTISASFTPADGGEPLTASATFRCIEPLRKLVTTEKSVGRYVNPSRLVMGTNAVLKVGANGDFSPSEVRWSVVSGPGVVYPTNGWETTVTPTGLGTVTVEARFNDDEIQPRFVLPVVQPRTIPVRAFVTKPPREQKTAAWSDGVILQHIGKANEIFSQIGVHFRLDGILHNVGNSNNWDICMYEERNYGTKWGMVQIEEHTEQFEKLVNVYTNRDCVKVFYVGTLRESSKVQTEGLFAEWTAQGILIPKGMPEESLAHELGHALGLFDIYLNNWRHAFEPPVRRVVIAEENSLLRKGFFGDTDCDWGKETGLGFYALSDTLGVKMKKLLMYGVHEDIDNIGCDIPDDAVFGLPAHATTQGDASLIAVGARETERHENTEVYSR